MEAIAEWFREAFVSGVDFTIEGNGGPDCVNLMSMQRRIIETIAFVVVCSWLWQYGYRRFDLYRTPLPKSRFGTSDPFGKRLLLVTLCVVFGMELGFKFATRQVIFIVNPCHVFTTMQIIFMIAKPSRRVTFWFRLHIHMLYGAFLAVAFPVVNTRFLHMEVITYWIQHILILFIVPAYLISLGGVYSVEKWNDWNYVAMAAGIFLPYNMIFLQFLGVYLEINLCSMVCNAVSDPFAGPNYKIYGLLYMPLLSMFFGKLMTLLYSVFVPIEREKSN
ncbi:expressed hypothetical protein [Trichoplax adhaerens]|uniref:Transmembrane protein 164 n=1 Tax=Trichoplax adhaerens TaxID=10228 RepID=B3SBM9_TRIAD|nr:expressed hypothetical protein [Trichoplax adhaerens]EDV19890.1 expressed hypothetical protein [Trichoplax adhaerens]|eukprot:XP_002117632.1 expressed hypothetical protein [Trichoplax adhaerens]